jgi:hypothetical protein
MQRGAAILGVLASLSACSSNNLGTLPICENVSEAVKVTRKVLLAFQACPGTLEECDANDQYQLWLAESDDLLNWSIVPGWKPYEAAQSDMIQRDRTVYLYSSPGAVRTLDLDLGTVSCAKSLEIIDIDGTTLTSTVLGPSPILSSDGETILLAFMTNEDANATDPTTCDTLPCTRTVVSASETKSGAGTRFMLASGSRVSLTLTSESPHAFDPEWLDTGALNGFLMLLPRSDSSIDLFGSTTVGASYAALGQVTERGSPASLLHDGETYFQFGAGLDTETPQNRVINIYSSSELSSLPSAALSFTFEGIDYPDLGGFPVQVKDPAVLVLQ